MKGIRLAPLARKLRATAERAKRWTLGQLLPVLPPPFSTLVHGGLNRLQPLFGGQRARRWETFLWGGLSEIALNELELLEHDPQAPKFERARAAQVSAIWHLTHRNPQAALAHASSASELVPAAAAMRLQAQLQGDALIELGRLAEARALLRDYLKVHPLDPHVLLSQANTLGSSAADEEARLDTVNALLRAEGLLPLRKSSSTQALSMSNLELAEESNAARPSDGPLVTVIVPVFNAEKSLAVALQGILLQTWQPLEILVVDDASTDGTLSIVHHFAKKDPRVVGLKQPSNRGSYAARNLALARAKGSFITVHDADDWSHPQKIERQVAHLLQFPEQQANLSSWVRVSPDFRFVGPARVTGEKLITNSSSLMVRAEVLRQVGGWDEVRVGADSELIERLESDFQQRIPVIAASAPLAFAEHSPESLTGRGPTHILTRLYGVRRSYMEAARHCLATRGPRVGEDRSERRFPAPESILPEPTAVTRVDLLAIADSNASGLVGERLWQLLHFARRRALRVGLVHLGSPQAARCQGTSFRALEEAQQGKLAIIAPGTAVSAPLTFVCNPELLSCPFDRPPQVTTGRALLFSARLPSGASRRDIEDHTRRLLFVPPEWIDDAEADSWESLLLPYLQS